MPTQQRPFATAAAGESTPRTPDWNKRLLGYLSTMEDLDAPINARLRELDAFTLDEIRYLRAIVLRQGRPFVTRERSYPFPAANGDRECFWKAQQAAQSEQMIYVEGFALSGSCYTTGRPGTYAFYHGWCVDKEGAVYDPNWQHRGLAYYGVRFRPDLVDKMVRFFDERLRATGEGRSPFLLHHISPIVVLPMGMIRPLL